MTSSARSSRQLLADAFYLPLKQYLIETTGLSYYAQKDEELAGHIARRLTALELGDCLAYLQLLRSGKDGETELDLLITDLTIGETFFFRHREQFEALRDLVLPDLIQRNRAHRRLRIWSAGCSTGAEPYTLAIMLKRDLAKLLTGWDVTILGTDINRDFLAHAQRGEFGDWAFRSSPEELKQSCFTRRNNLWVINPEFRHWVSFQYHNLVQHPFPSLVNNLYAFDLILCRNVMIYFNQEIIRKTLSHFHDCLVDGGWLVVGHAEPNVEFFRAFRTVNAPGTVLYQKAQQTTTPTGWVPPRLPSFEPRPAVAPSPWTPPVLPPLPAAVQEASKAAPARPAAPAAPLSLADVKRNADRGEWEEADRCCQELVARERLNPALHFYHALVLEQTGRHAETEQALRRTIYLDRNFVLAHYYLGLLLQRNQNAEGARRSFRNVIQLLQARDEADVFADADGITAGELKKLTNMHLEVLGSL